jgi:glycosyltransferase involved in cell wall biosynthesis
LKFIELFVFEKKAMKFSAVDLTQHQRYHIVLRQVADLAKEKVECKLGQRPLLDILQIQENLNASIHLPNLPISNQDRIAALFEGKPENWALARDLVTRLNENDVIFCISEDAAIPIAALCAFKKNRPRIVSFFHNFIRPRGLTSTKLFRVASTIDLFLVVSVYQGQFLQKYLNVPDSRIRFIWDEVDTTFFRPAVEVTKKARPIIASVGLEKRDYKLIAAATHDMDIEVKISGASEHAKQLKHSFPEVMPANMSRRFYAWHELLELYQQADIVVVSVFECNYAAGITSILEAMSCKRPIIATKTKGLEAYFEADAILAVAPGDVEGLRQAIRYFLEHPEKAREYAERGYELALKRHYVEDFADTIATYMRNIR